MFDLHGCTFSSIERKGAVVHSFAVVLQNISELYRASK